jgi:hypothetical protein
MRQLYAVIALVAATACESDETRLQQLQAARAISCRPVGQADSAASARSLARARINAGGASVDEARADVEELKHELAELQRQAALSPTQAAAELDSTSAARRKCELAQRDLNRFMAGR